MNTDTVAINIEDTDENICIKINKLDNLFTSKNSTPLNIIKNTISTYINELVNKIESKSLLNDIYIGTVQNSNIKGEGLLIKKNNILIKGTFNNIYTITNSKTILNNITLEGIIKNGDFYSGTVTSNDKNIKIIGTFKEGLPDNTIKYFDNNSIYEGQCKLGMFNGKGSYTNGNISYEGEWLNNRFHGHGLIITDDYNYEGVFFNGKKHGSGKLEISDKTYYATYENDVEIYKLDYDKKKIQDLELKINNLENTDKNHITLIKQQEKQIIECNNKIKLVENEKKLLEEQSSCKVCFKNIANILLQPCNHCVICESCEITIRASQNGRRCPICRKPYAKYIKIFI